MARPSTFTLSDRVPLGSALPPDRGSWSQPELASMDEFAAADPDTYRRLSQPKDPVNANFDLESVEDEDEGGALDTDLRDFIAAMGTDDLEDFPVQELSRLEADLLGLTSEDSTTLPAFDFRKMAPILEERERTGARMAVVEAQAPMRSEEVVQTPSQPRTAKELLAVVPAIDPRPRRPAPRALSRESRIARRLWRRDVERLAS